MKESEEILGEPASKRCTSVGGNLFCETCGRRRTGTDDISSRILGGLGPNSSNHRIQTFLETGDPSVMA